MIASAAAGSRGLQSSQRSPANVIRIPFETYSLPNGLAIILSPDHTTPTVAVDDWYHVSSSNELPRRFGFAHLFAHVIFTGLLHVPYGLHDKLSEGADCIFQGTTLNDCPMCYQT